MPLSEFVKFLTKLHKWNRIQIPVEVRWRYKLEAEDLLKVSVSLVDGFDNEEFIVKLMHGGRFTIPWEVVWALKLDKPGYMLQVELKPE